MNYKELEQKIGTQIEADWKQASGGGWIHKSAKVDHPGNLKENCIVRGVVSENAQVYGSAVVSGSAQVCGSAVVSENARVSGSAVVSGSARVSGSAVVSGSAQVYGSAVVSGSAQVCGSAVVSGSAQVCGSARVSGSTWVKPVLFLLDSRGYGTTNCKHGWLRIGCQEHTFQDWKSHFSALVRKHNLSKEEIVEYRAIVALFCKIGK